MSLTAWAIQVHEQATELAKDLFPGIDLSFVEELSQKLIVPDNVSGVFVLPKLSFLAKFWNLEVDPFSSDGYHAIFEKVMLLTTQRRRCIATQAFQGDVEGDKFLGLIPKVKTKLRQLEDETPGDAIVLPCSLEWSLTGSQLSSVRNCLPEDMMVLTAVHLACILLVMPERLGLFNDDCISCVGELYESKFTNTDESGLCFAFINEAKPCPILDDIIRKGKPKPTNLKTGLCWAWIDDIDDPNAGNNLAMAWLS